MASAVSTGSARTDRIISNGEIGSILNWAWTGEASMDERPTGAPHAKKTQAIAILAVVVMTVSRCSWAVCRAGTTNARFTRVAPKRETSSLLKVRLDANRQ